MNGLRKTYPIDVRAKASRFETRQTRQTHLPRCTQCAVTLADRGLDRLDGIWGADLRSDSPGARRR